MWLEETGRLIWNTLSDFHEKFDKDKFLIHCSYQLWVISDTNWVL
jgi:hypothetical protein